MSVEPMITTVIPTYRRPELLKRAIRSVLDQTYSNFKLCVYDNASNDETGRLVNAIASRDSRVHYYCHKENIGSQENFHFGLSRVDTAFFNLLSDDDFLLPGFFDSALTALVNSPEAAFFSGGLVRAAPDGRVMGCPRYGSERQRIYSPPLLFYTLAPYTRTWTSILFRWTTVKSVGGLRKEIGYSFPVDLLLRLATRYRAVLSDAPCAVFTVHPDSISCAESAEALEALLDLALFDSVNQAIESASTEMIVTNEEAAGMKAMFRSLTERNLFRNAFSLIKRKRLAAALRSSNILREVFRRKDTAAMIHFASMNNEIGDLIRLGIRTIGRISEVWSAMHRAEGCPDHSRLVKNRISQLRSYDCEPAGEVA